MLLLNLSSTSLSCFLGSRGAIRSLVPLDPVDFGEWVLLLVSEYYVWIDALGSRGAKSHLVFRCSEVRAALCKVRRVCQLLRRYALFCV